MGSLSFRRININPRSPKITAHTPQVHGLTSGVNLKLGPATVGVPTGLGSVSYLKSRAQIRAFFFFWPSFASLDGRAVTKAASVDESAPQILLTTE